MGRAKDLLIEWQDQETQLEDDLAEAEFELTNMLGRGEPEHKLHAQERRIKEIQDELESVRELLGRGSTSKKIEELKKNVEFIEQQLDKWRDEVRGTGHSELRTASKVLLTFAGALIGITVTIGVGLKPPSPEQDYLMAHTVAWAFVSALIGLGIPLSGIIVNLLASFGKSSVPQPAAHVGDKPLKMPPRWLLPCLLWTHGGLLLLQMAAWIVAMTAFIPLVLSL